MDLKQLARDTRSIARQLEELRVEAAASADSLGLCPFHMNVIDEILTAIGVSLEEFAVGADKKRPCSERDSSDIVSMLESVFGPGTVIIMDEDKEAN